MTWAISLTERVMWFCGGAICALALSGGDAPLFAEAAQ